MGKNIATQNDASKKERMRFAMTGGALSMISFIIGSYFMQYLSEVMLVEVGMAGLIIGLMRAFDAINDPIMGIITDKTSTKWGKAKPYLILMPAPLILFAVLIFLPLTPGSSLSITMVVIFYVLYTIFYTLYDIPFWSMTSLMIRDSQLKVKTISWTKMLSNALGPLTVVLFINLVSILKGSSASTSHGYFYSILIFAAIVLPITLLGGFTFKERVDTKEDTKVDTRHLISTALTSRPMIINLVAGLMSTIAGVGGLVMNTYFIKWNIWQLVQSGESSIVNKLAGNAFDPVAVQGVFTIVIGLMPTLAAIAGLALTPLLAKKFAKKDVIVVSGILGGALNILVYFLGYKNIVLLIVSRFLVFIPMGIFNGMFTASFNDAIDYIYYEKKIRAEGICFSILTFLSKFSGSIASVLAGFMLSFVGFDKNLQLAIDNILKTVHAGTVPTQQIIDATRAIQQPQSALSGIFFMMTVLMGIGQILVALPFLFSNLNKQKLLEMETALVAENIALEDSNE